MNTEELERNLRNSTAAYPLKASRLVHGIQLITCPDCPLKNEDPPVPFLMKDQKCLERCPYNIIVWILSEEQEIIYQKYRLDEKKRNDLEMAINEHKVALVEKTIGRASESTTLPIFLNKNYMINFEEFKKIDLRVVKIIKAERVESSEKLIKLEVDGEEEKRQIVAGIGKYYKPEDLVGKEIIMVWNLEPKILFGLESQGMLLAAKNGEEPIILVPEKEAPVGAKIS